VVVRFSGARMRYERKGIPVSESALDQAEEECFADSKLRALRRERIEVVSRLPARRGRTIAVNTARAGQRTGRAQMVRRNTYPGYVGFLIDKGTPASQARFAIAMRTVGENMEKLTRLFATEADSGKDTSRLDYPAAETAGSEINNRGRFATSGNTSLPAGEVFLDNAIHAKSNSQSGDRDCAVALVCCRSGSIACNLFWWGAKSPSGPGAEAVAPGVSDKVFQCDSTDLCRPAS
jgi:hypothetical protein